MRAAEQKLLVIGCGSGLTGDDAVGAHTVCLLASAPSHHDTRFLSMCRPGLELLDLLEQEERILFIDTIDSGRPPGTIVLTPLPAEELKHGSSGGEDWGLNDVLALARSLGRRVPYTTLIGIEGEKTDSLLLSEHATRAANFILDNFETLKPFIVSGEPLVLEAEPAHA